MHEEPTTPDLVECVRVILEAADRADFDTIMSFYSPAATWEVRGGGTFSGVEAIRALFEDYYEPYEELRVEVDEVRDFGNGVVLAVNRQTARFVGSAVDVRTREAFIYVWEEGKVVQVVMVQDIGEAHATAEQLARDRRQQLPEHVTLVRSIITDWERGDWSRSDWADPDIELVLVDGPSPGRWKGIAEIAVGARTAVIDAWEDYRLEAVEYRDLGDARVLVLFHALGRGKASGIALDQGMRGEPSANVFHIRASRVIRIDAYFGASRALAELGLSG
jgi:ketosteroid isomerase-like protein